MAHANPSKNRTPRHRARELALQGVYQWLCNRSSAEVVEEHIREAYGFDKADADYFVLLLHGVIAQSTTLQQQLQPFTDRPIAEVSLIERAVLLIGAYELITQLEIPYRVILNEAIELAKSFGTTDGHKYVNGILDKLAASIRQHEAK